MGVVNIAVSPGVSSTQGVLMERWNNITGGLGALTGDSDYPNSPDSSSTRSSFESPSNFSNNYGLRMRAHLIAPTTTGLYDILYCDR